MSIFLVGNAAANPHYGPIVDVDEISFDKIIDTNVKANLWLCKLLLPAMADRRDGVVILITSIAGLQGTDDIGVYGLSKAAESSMARSLAVGWGEHNIRVNCIAPGLVKTDFARTLWDDAEKLRRAEAAYPLKRIGEPDDIAGIAVFLASPAGSFITGQTIVADGGRIDSRLSKLVQCQAELRAKGCLIKHRIRLMIRSLRRAYANPQKSCSYIPVKMQYSID